MGAIRRVGFVLFALAAIFVFVEKAPPSADIGVARAQARFNMNEDETESAPQQQVLNGWQTNDLLEVIAESQDVRPAALLLIAILALMFHFITAGIATEPKTPVAAASPPPLPTVNPTTPRPPADPTSQESWDRFAEDER